MRIPGSQARQVSTINRWTAALAAAAWLAAGGSAEAATRVMTFTGQVASLNDENHVISPVLFNDLLDKSFTAMVTFDLPSAGLVTFSGVQLVSGGAQVGRPAFVSGSLTIAGNTHVFANDRFGSVGVGGDAAGAQIEGLFGGLAEQLALNANLTPGPAADLSVDFAATQPLADTGSGFRAVNAQGDVALGVLFIDRVTLGDAVTAAIPEPGAWALMIGGFAMAGAALRRRRLSAA